MNGEAGQLISRLGLVPLPNEGGFFAHTWTSPERMADGRPCGSAILFLITSADFSALHRLGMDEIWHFHAGDAAELTLLEPVSGSRRSLLLGADVANGNAPYAVVPAGVWQGARLRPGAAEPARGWALFSCTVAPAWDERKFELGEGPALLREFPAHAAVIKALTR
jgi:predicted cupin superfamily sugar epimerase